MNSYNSGLRFNMLNSVQYNSQVVKSIRQIYTRLGIRPIILDQNKNALAVLENSFDIELDQEVNGIDELNFSLPYTDSKKDYLVNENLIQMYETIYIIRKVEKRKGSNAPQIDVYAEALWYDLQFSDPLKVTSWVDSTPSQILTDLLKGTGWKVGTVEISTKRTLTLDEEADNSLVGITSARDLFGGDLIYDTDAMEVSLLNEQTKHSGAAIIYKKNMSEINAIYDTRDLVTRLYVYGQNGLTIEDANNGVKYVEDFSFTSKVRSRSIKNEQFTNPFSLKEWADDQIKILCKPSASYQITAEDLSSLSGLSHEKFAIGYIVRVYDEELDMDENTRIMKWTYNVVEPWKTKIELETTVKLLSDLLADGASYTSGFASEDSVSNQEILQLMVFNYLLNSRADDGFAYWTNTGWDIDAVNGYSGPASFKVVGTLGQSKELKQTIYPSHRESYSISFRAFADSLVKGPNGRVGTNIKITYEDGTVDNQFIPLV
ncbi:phage tail protein [Priestia megaterium]|uniref:phage tail protein n=1 Tax=Priestia megaterium TaxID=1404 RepID=UPI000BEB2B0A|nr:phage tail protein [Priestia megaterium]PED63965.1 hypothetical protein CON20_23650 [Priestia megaterium]